MPPGISFSCQGIKYEDDLSRFTPESFTVIANRLCEIVEFDANTLERKLAILQELDADFSKIMKLAAQKLLYAYAENDSAESITATMKEQCFEMQDYVYEGDQEGIINYVNHISREKLTVVLSPREDGLQLDVHNFGDDGSGCMDPIRQDHILEMLEQALNISVSCSSRGSVSAHTDAANLSKVQHSKYTGFRCSPPQAFRRNATLWHSPEGWASDGSCTSTCGILSTICPVPSDVLNQVERESSAKEATVNDEAHNDVVHPMEFGKA